MLTLKHTHSVGEKASTSNVDEWAITYTGQEPIIPRDLI